MWFQQYEAPSHTDEIVKDYSKATFGDRKLAADQMFDGQQKVQICIQWTIESGDMLLLLCPKNLIIWAI